MHLTNVAFPSHPRPLSMCMTFLQKPANQVFSPFPPIPPPFLFKEPERIGIADYMTAMTPDPYVCSTCYVVFPSASLLADHQTTHEAAPIDSDSAHPALPPNLLNPHSNDDSGSENGDDGIMIEGYAHPNGKDYLCTICNKLFKRKDYFKQHMLSHSRKFQCPHCAFNFARKDHLGRHLKNRVCLRGLETDPVGSKTARIVDGDVDDEDDDDADEEEGEEEEDDEPVVITTRGPTVATNKSGATGSGKRENASGTTRESRSSISSYFSPSRRSKREIDDH